VTRKAETDELLEAFEAARLMQLDSTKYGVTDGSTTQLVHTWEEQYKFKLSEYNFYCTQTQEDLAAISDAVAKKEAAAVENAAQAGLMAAETAIEHKRVAKEKANKVTSERKQKKDEMTQKDHAQAQEKTDKETSKALEEATKRLKALPQLQMNLFGAVKDAMTGKPLEGANVHSKCLFHAAAGSTRDNGKFTLSNGISGPSGRKCTFRVSKEGYVDTGYAVTVMDSQHTDSRFLQTVIPPVFDVKAATWPTDKNKFRFVVQWSEQPTDLDAHVLVPMPQKKYTDVGASALLPKSTTVTYGLKGDAENDIYATLDHQESKGFGPEMITVHKMNDGVYHFMVSNAAQQYTTETQFKYSNARAFLYQGNKLVDAVAIDTATGDPTQLWSVYTLSCKEAVCGFKVDNKFLTAAGPL